MTAGICKLCGRFVVVFNGYIVHHDGCDGAGTVPRKDYVDRRSWNYQTFAAAPEAL